MEYRTPAAERALTHTLENREAAHAELAAKLESLKALPKDPERTKRIERLESQIAEETAHIEALQEAVPNLEVLSIEEQADRLYQHKKREAKIEELATQKLIADPEVDTAILEAQIEAVRDVREPDKGDHK